MYTEEREIRVIDLLIYVAKGWRNIFIWMLIMAIVIGAVQYVKEVRAVKDYESTKQVTMEEEKEQVIFTVEQLRQEMSSQEILAVNRVVRLEKEYTQLSDYVKNSLYMTMDPYNVSIAKIQYWINTDYEVNYMGITEKDRTDDLVDAYINYLEDSQWRKEALEVAREDIELQYFSELISFGDYGDSFIVVIKYPDEEKLREILPVLKETVNDYQKQIEKIYGKHELNLVNESVEVTADNDVYNIQYNRNSVLLNLENNIINYKNAFNDNQKSLYAGEILVNEEQVEAEEKAAADAAAPPTPQIRVKYVVLGAILGAFLVCMVRAMAYILSNKLKAEDNVSAYLGVTSLGLIMEDKAFTKGVVGKVDAWLDSLAKRNLGNLTKEQQLKMAVSNILLYCEKGNMKQIYLNSSINCLEEKAGELVQMLNERGITVKDGFSILQDASAMEEMSKADGVVFIEQAGKSRYEDLEREVKLCKEHEKTVIGLVVLS